MLFSLLTRFRARFGNTRLYSSFRKQIKLSMKGNFGSHVDQMSQGVLWLWIFKRDYIRSKYVCFFNRKCNFDAFRDLIGF